MSTIIKVGLYGEADFPWEQIRKAVASKDIEIEIVRFDSFFTPNPALDKGEIDLNMFQHKAFLQAEISAHHYALTGLCTTYLDPIGMYSRKYKSVKELKDGDHIVIPSDPSNGGRALKVLNDAGIITTDPKKGYVPDVADIIDNPLKLQFDKVIPEGLMKSLDDTQTAAAFVNGNFAFAGGLNARRDAILCESLNPDDADNPFVKVLVARTADKDRPELLEIVKAYQSRESAEIIAAAEGGHLIPAFNY